MMERPSHQPSTIRLEAVASTWMETNLAASPPVLAQGPSLGLKRNMCK